MRCRELAETILDSGDTLLTILGDILDFSKIDHNSMVLESAPVRAFSSHSLLPDLLWRITIAQLAIILYGLS